MGIFSFLREFFLAMIKIILFEGIKVKHTTEFNSELKH